MALSSTPYNGARYELGKGAVNLSTANLAVLLCGSGYTPDRDAHKFLSSVTNEASGNGYARQALTTVTWTQSDAIDRAVLKSDPVAFSASGGPITARYAVLFVDTGNAATSLLLECILLDTAPADVSAQDGGQIVLSPDATNGWLQI